MNESAISSYLCYGWKTEILLTMAQYVCFAEQAILLIKKENEVSDYGTSKTYISE